jgi:hypothetical protein
MAILIYALLGTAAIAAGFAGLLVKFGVESVTVPTAVVAILVTAFLWWRGTTAGLVWAWATALFGLESLALPLATMIQIRQAGAEPTPEQMGQLIVAVLFGLIPAIFLLTLSYGLFTRLSREPPAES